jgi:hypothetical protein
MPKGSKRRPAEATELLNFRMPSKFADDLKRLAERDYRSVTGQISFIIQEYIKSNVIEVGGSDA